MKLSLSCAFLLYFLSAVARAGSLPAYEFQAVAASREASPAVDLDDPRNAGLAAALAFHRAPATLGLADAGERIASMTAAGLLTRQADGSYRPAFPVIDGTAAKAFAAIDPELAERMAKMVESHAARLQAAAPDLPALFLFGDIPFDRWQVRNVRSQFLGGYPPPRGGKEFYIADVESDPASPVAAAGFFSHGEQSYGGLSLVTFGNARTIDPLADKAPEEAARLLAGYVAFARGGAAPDPALTELGFIENGKPAVTVISRAAYGRLPALAGSLTADLIALLESDRPVVEAAYRASPLAQTTSFREFGLWWYHFLYAGAIERLIRDRRIDAPRVGGAMLVVAPD